MSELKDWRDLPVAGRVTPSTAEQLHTGGWRTGVMPEVELSACVNCLLCWIYCPDSAITGFDYDYCKGCELCAEVCPTGAITMVEELT